MLKKKIWANFQRIIELFTQKIVTRLSKIWVWDSGSGIRDPGSGKNLFRIPNPVSRGQKGTGSRIRILNTGADTPWVSCSTGGLSIQLRQLWQQILTCTIISLYYTLYPLYSSCRNKVGRLRCSSPLAIGRPSQVCSPDMSRYHFSSLSQLLCSIVPQKCPRTPTEGHLVNFNFRIFSFLLVRALAVDRLTACIATFALLPIFSTSC